MPADAPDQRQANQLEETSSAREHRAMDLTRKANLVLGIAGSLAAWASGSQALLIDGLFSLIGYVSAVFAMRISRTAHLGPDRRRPFGYAADEALYGTFRSFALIGVVVFGIAQSIMGITGYLLDGDAEEIWLTPVALYTVLVTSTCFWLAFVHFRAWAGTGRRSDMLRLEMNASFYDGFITLAAGLGLLSAPHLAGTVLAPLAPIMDSIVVAFICGIAIFGYLTAFRRGVTQLAGVPASSREQLATRHIVKPVVEAQGGQLLDVALVRMGRMLDAVVYYEPDGPVAAARVDELRDQIKSAMEERLGPAHVLLVVSARRLSD